MKYRCEMRADKVTAEPWGPAFMREMDLVVAQNALMGIHGEPVVYDDVLDARAAHFCAAFDMGLTNDFLGVERVVPDVENPYRTLDPYMDALLSKPRGTWTILEMDGGFDAYMSDGYGGIGTRSGNKFRHRSARSPDLSYEATYAATLGYLTYDRRKAIEAEIHSHSGIVHALPVGAVARDKRLSGRQFDRVELRGFEDGQYVVKASLRGARTLHFKVPPSTYGYLFDAPKTLPPEFVAADGIDRTMTLAERRIEVARSEWKRLSEEGVGVDKVPVGFRAVSGDAVVGLLDHRQEDYATCEFRVDFAVGGTEVVAVKPSPSPTMAM